MLGELGADIRVELKDLAGEGRSRHDLAGKISARWQSVLSEDDVMQQTYADVFQDIGRFVPQDDGSFVAWLTTLANRKLLDGVKMLEREKRGGRRRRVEAGSGDASYMALYELIGVDTTTPSRHVAREEARAVLERAVKRLPSAYREVVRMYDLDGQPVQQVADALGCRRHRARRGLKTVQSALYSLGGRKTHRLP